MNTPTGIIQQLPDTLKKHSPVIMTSLGALGLISTAIMAVKVTPQALEVIHAEKVRIAEEASDPDDIVVPEDVDIPLMDQGRLVWKLYLPTALIGGLSIAAIFSAQHVNVKRNTAIAGAYSLAQTTLNEYKNKVVETIGEKKETAIHDEIMKDHFKKAEETAKNDEPIIVGDDEVLCLDNLSGRFFKMRMVDLERLEVKLQKQLVADDWVSLNDMYYGMGLRSTKLGDTQGWHSETGDQIHFKYSSVLTDNNQPALVVDVETSPKDTFYGD